MRTRVVIQSRMSSTRLPGKAMLTLAGMPLIELVARRVANTGHEVIVATSQERLDDHIVAHLESVGVPVMRGPLDDVLARFVAATQDLDPSDRVVRMTGDNPIADGTLIDELAAAMDLSGHSYGRVDIDQVPEGIGCEVFTVANLRETDAHAELAYDREHVTPLTRRRFGELLWAPSGITTDVHAYRATVDSLPDYDRVARLFATAPEPLAVSFRTLMHQVVQAVDAAGPRVPDGPDGLPSTIIDLRASAAQGAATRREMLTVAADRGADLVLVDPSEPADLALCADSALRGKIRLVLDLRQLAPSATTDQVALVIERALAALATRRVLALAVTTDSVGQQVAADYLRDRVADQVLTADQIRGRLAPAV